MLDYLVKQGARISVGVANTRLRLEYFKPCFGKIILSRGPFLRFGKQNITVRLNGIRLFDWWNCSRRREAAQQTQIQLVIIFMFVLVTLVLMMEKSFLSRLYAVILRTWLQRWASAHSGHRKTKHWLYVYLGLWIIPGIIFIIDYHCLASVISLNCITIKSVV